MDGFYVLLISLNFLFNINFVVANEEDSNSTIISCYECDKSEECLLDQDPENSTITECGEGQHCWIWSSEEGEVELYTRGCGDACSDESREMDCKTSGNSTECSVCCSTSRCNDGSVNGVEEFGINSNLLLLCLAANFFTFFLSGKSFMD